MMVRRRRSFENGCRGRRWVWLTGLLIVLAVGIPIALACDVTKVDLWIGDDEAAATGENENTVYKEAGESFGWFVKWEAGGATSGDYEGEVYLEGVEEDTFTKSAAPWEASGSVTIPTDMPVGTGKKVEAKVRKVDSSVELTAEVTNLTVVSFKIDTPDSFPVYVAVGDTLALGCTFEPTDVTGETYLWTKDSGPGTVTFSPSATTEDPTFSADTAGKYKVKAECSIGGYTFDDTTKGDIVVVASGSLVLEDLHTGNSDVDETNADPPPPDPVYCGTDTDKKGDVEFWVVDPDSGASYDWEISPGSESGTLDESNDYKDQANDLEAGKEYTITLTTGGDPDYERVIEFVIPKVEITDDAGVPITGTQTVSVGEEISLDTAIEPAGLTADKWQWTVPVKAIKDYVKDDVASGRTKAMW